MKKNGTFHKRLAGSVLMLGFLLFALPCHGMELVFASHVRVSGDTLHLSDIATITPATRSTAGLMEKQLYIRSPRPGKTITMARVDLQSYLSHKYPSVREATWSGAETITITRKAQVISREEVRTAIENYLQSQKTRYPGSDIRLTSLDAPALRYLPTGTLDIEVVPSKSDLLHSNRFTLLVRVDGKVVENFSVTAAIEAIAPVVTARKDIRRGRVLTKDDVGVTRVDLTEVRRTPISSTAQAVGKQAQRFIRRGQILEPSFIDLPTIVKRGDVVLISARSGALVVTAKGVALKDGKKGQVIGIKNLGSRKTLLARVTAPGNVEVRF